MEGIELVLGEEDTRILEIEDGQSRTLGRDPGCDVRINHPSISPIHCRLAFSDGVLSITDLESREGVTFKGKKVKRLEFTGSASFLVGSVPVTLRRFAGVESRIPSTGGWSRYRDRWKKRAAPSSGAMGALLRRGARTALRKSPFFLLSMVVHFVLFLLLADVPYFTRQFRPVHRILAGLITPLDVVRLEEPATEKRLEEPELEEPEPVEEEPVDLPFADLPAPEPSSEPLPRPFSILVAGIGTGGRLRTGLAGEGTADLGAVHRRRFKHYIRGLRSRGMDIAFVVDSTSSMVPFIEQAKEMVGTLISRLAAVVPNLRMAMVTYRDREDSYVTRWLEFTRDRYEILNFLEDTRAAGGGDFPEAIDQALDRAIHTLGWRKGARKVIILVGDAACHQEGEGKVESLLRSFSKGDPPGVVNTVYVGKLSNPPTTNEDKALECFRRIARLARGEFLWSSERNRLLQQLVDLTFGTRWSKDIQALLRTVKADRMARLVARKARAGDLPWLLEGLKKIPVHPGIVEALIRDAGPKELKVLAQYLQSDDLPSGTKWAALYILRKRLRRSLPYNPYTDPNAQEQEILYIERALSDYKGG